MLTDYIPSYDDVRAVIGADTEDLEDTEIELKVIELQLVDVLDSISENLTGIYEDIQVRLKDPLQTTTKLERKIVGTLQVLSTYFVALILAPTFPVKILRKITDGKATGERTAEPFEKLQVELEETVATLIDRMKDLLEEYGEEVTRDTYGALTMSVGLAVDPVTGE